MSKEECLIAFVFSLAGFIVGGVTFGSIAAGCTQSDMEKAAISKGHATYEPHGMSSYRFKWK